MTSRTIVHLVRHGEVDNPEGVLYERLPGFHLTRRGRAMAEGVAASLRTRDIVQLRVSPLERAQETAEPLATALGLEPIIDPRVIESSNKFAGGTFRGPDSVLRSPANWKYLTNPLKPSWGEPYSTISARMLKAMYEARDAAEGHEAVIVSHQLPIWIARLSVEHKRFAHSPNSRICTLCSVTSFHFDDTHISRISYHEPVRHLLPDGAERDAFSSGSNDPDPSADEV